MRLDSLPIITAHSLKPVRRFGEARCLYLNGHASVASMAKVDVGVLAAVGF